MKNNEALDVLHVGLLSPQAEMSQTCRSSDLIQKFGRRHTDFLFLIG
jgi:hypothetical protein